ncbi:MAG: DUF1223 domain-containing protein [Alcanivorax sp.]|nr:DUF1223 domain-containing protein [Alcanivorax sp.]
MRLSALLLVILTHCALAEPLQFSSGPAQVPLIELYTSQGCSSCPPADRFLNQLKNQPGLFRTFIPLAFHVDYWDYLGWQDPFARPAFSARQRRYASRGAVHSVYTPGFVINGKEWRGFFRQPSAWQHQLQHPERGTLSVTLKQHRLRVHFDGALSPDSRLYAAWLGNGLRTRVAAGENGGRQLQQDFVVLAWLQQPFNGPDSVIALPDAPARGQQQTALVVWLSPADSPAPIQATGGYLPRSLSAAAAASQ